MCDPPRAHIMVLFCFPKGGAAMPTTAVNAALEAVRAFPGRAGLYWQDLATGEEAEFRGAEPFEAASVIKLPVLVELFRQLEAGEAREEEPFSVREEEKLPSCGALNYLHTGVTVNLMDLGVLMIILSDNTATNLLIRRLGMEKIQATIAALGMEVTALRRLGILGDQRLNGKIPFWLDGRVKCAHKTGEDSGITHDAAIVYAPRPFVLCVCGDPVKAPALNALMGEIARDLVLEQGVAL